MLSTYTTYDYLVTVTFLKEGSLLCTKSQLSPQTNSLCLRGCKKHDRSPSPRGKHAQSKAQKLPSRRRSAHGISLRLLLLTPGSARHGANLRADEQIHSGTYVRGTTEGKQRGQRSRARSPARPSPRAPTFTWMPARAPADTEDPLEDIWASWVYSYVAKTKGMME